MGDFKEKLLQLLVSIVIVSMLIIGVQSCSDRDNLQSEKTTQDEYVVFSQSLSSALGCVLNDLEVPKTRGTSTILNDETVSYLLQLTSDEVNAWHDKIIATYGEEFYRYYDPDKVKSAFSESQINEFKEFLDIYLTSGIVNNQELLESYVSKSDSKERQLYILGAVYIDGIVRPLLNELPMVQTRGMSHCELELTERILADTAESVIMDIVLDDMDNPVIDIWCTAEDLDAVLEAMKDYHKCREGL